MHIYIYGHLRAHSRRLDAPVYAQLGVTAGEEGVEEAQRDLRGRLGGDKGEISGQPTRVCSAERAVEASGRCVGGEWAR